MVNHSFFFPPRKITYEKYGQLKELHLTKPIRSPTCSKSVTLSLFKYFTLFVAYTYQLETWNGTIWVLCSVTNNQCDFSIQGKLFTTSLCGFRQCKQRKRIKCVFSSLERISVFLDMLQIQCKIFARTSLLQFILI